MYERTKPYERRIHGELEGKYIWGSAPLRNNAISRGRRAEKLRMSRDRLIDGGEQ